jgi:hypothetical protein
MNIGRLEATPILNHDFFGHLEPVSAATNWLNLEIQAQIATSYQTN